MPKKRKEKCFESTNETFKNAASKKLPIISSVFFPIVIVYEFFPKRNTLPYVLSCFFFLGCIKDDKPKSSNLEHDTVILVYELFHILHQTFHETEDSSDAVGLLLHHRK